MGTCFSKTNNVGAKKLKSTKQQGHATERRNLVSIHPSSGPENVPNVSNDIIVNGGRSTQTVVEKRQEELLMPKPTYLNSSARMAYLTDSMTKVPSKGRLFMSALPRHMVPENKYILIAENSPSPFSSSPTDEINQLVYTKTPVAAEKPYRSSSTSSLFLTSTIHKPDPDELLKCVAKAVAALGNRGMSSPAKRYLPLFDENNHPITEEGPIAPNEENIFEFVNTIFQAAKLSSECAVILMVYLERLVTLSGLTLDETNWKWVVLGSIMLAAKVWDDMAVWNVDFLDSFPNLSVQTLNRIEREFLGLLKFNVVVSGSVYAKYYFDLRAISEKKCSLFPLQPLDLQGAHKLEARSAASETEVKDIIQRSTSVDSVGIRRKKAAAVLN
eukprot:GCRY01003527.1.p1 GENE.GCRY01003527.1~~GCRY01003527.1.p1  ORF type:complete len:386 (-),score=96.53 GCRY01003527.1:793-1950(-)